MLRCINTVSPVDPFDVSFACDPVSPLVDVSFECDPVSSLVDPFEVSFGCDPVSAAALDPRREYAPVSRGVGDSQGLALTSEDLRAPSGDNFRCDPVSPVVAPFDVNRG